METQVKIRYGITQNNDEDEGRNTIEISGAMKERKPLRPMSERLKNRRKRKNDERYE